ncbi:tocopherol cyclase [Entomortierella parvispora]|uniref:Tocopherol cyclase n=1 Tax=Entomortierella parvispora TaxID=205924 RepID=A0A9P3HL40_9FUNG|nr:tocopherol cyclase [Entomortierella parvispora]
MKDPSFPSPDLATGYARARPRRRLIQTAVLAVLSAMLIQFTLSPTSKASYFWSNVKNLHRPLQYHGQHIRSNFFEGWYFKIVKPGLTKDDPTIGMALIPGIYRPPSPRSPLSEPSQNGGVDKGEDSRAHAFVMILGLPGTQKSAYYRFPIKEFVDLGSQEPGQERAFRVRIGQSVFAHDGIVLNLPKDRFEQVPEEELEAFYTEASQQYERQYRATVEDDHPVSDFRAMFPSQKDLKALASLEPFAVKGQFRFSAGLQTPLPTSRLYPSIMGFTAYLPFLECNHGVASLHHPIEDGLISVVTASGAITESVFDGGVGYTEKDWGINFPSTWIWGQTNIFEKAPGSSLLLSVASIPVLGPDVSEWVSTHLPILSSLTNVPGLLLVYYHASTKTMYNFSSYIFAARLENLKVTMDIERRLQTVSFTAVTKDPQNGQETVALQVQMTREIGTGVPLRAPSRSQRRMATAVEETIIANTKMKLWRMGSGEIIVEDEGQGSGLEVVGDIGWLERRFLVSSL